MLLYLNNATFVGENREGLINDVRNARASGITIVLAHENDAERGGCQFSRFFETTPPQLVEDGLYKTLAQPLYEREHRTVGLKMLAIALGGMPLRNVVAQAAVDVRSGATKASRALQQSGELPPNLRNTASAMNIVLKSAASRMNISRTSSAQWQSTRLSNEHSSRRSGVAGWLRDRRTSSQGSARNDRIRFGSGLANRSRVAHRFGDVARESATS